MFTLLFEPFFLRTNFLTNPTTDLNIYLPTYAPIFLLIIMFTYLLMFFT
jgi:hypothetical protein